MVSISRCQEWEPPQILPFIHQQHPLDSENRPCFTVSMLGELTTVIKQKKPRKILVSFRPLHVGTFLATLRITFSDKTRPNNSEFTVIRELRGSAILPDDPATSPEPPQTVGEAEEDMMESEDTGITVSDDLGLEFSVERSQSDESFPMQKKELVITKSSVKPLVSFKAGRVWLPDDSVKGWFSAHLEGDSKWIKNDRQRIVAVHFTPQFQGVCDAVLELTFCDHKRWEDFVIKRTLRGSAKQLTGGQEHLQSGPAHNPRSQSINNYANNQIGIPSDEEEFLDSSNFGISVSHEDGLDFGIVERKNPNGPFATSSSLLTITLAHGFPAVIFIKERSRTLDGSDPEFIVVFERDSHCMLPGVESAVRVIFSPKSEGPFRATLELIFYHSQLSAWIVVRRRLQGIAGTLGDHKHFEPISKEDAGEPTEGRRDVLPRKIIPLLSPDRRRRSRNFPDYKVPPIVQSAVDKSTSRCPYDQNAPDLLSLLRPDSLSLNTYANYFNALLNVEDGHQQYFP
ncbi:hypothetical protein BJV74DRAFT_460254 [Russula compacta]|nr:hypothetical protein BJV74DRAFT_460254 [Russula compacta]